MPTSLDEYRRLRDTRVGVDRTRTLSFYRTLSSTVSIVSAMSEELGPLGLTVSAVSAVSAEPPLLSVCLAHESQTLRAAAESGRF
ncbi:flavin reductase family protein, partial [Mycobacteroides abscessus]